MHRGRTVILLATVLVAIGCSKDDGTHPDPGALIRTTAQSSVGVVLDEIPASMRARVTASLVARPDSFWQDRAMAQLRLTTYRLVFRGYFYDEEKGQLPLPPESLWSITLTTEPSRQMVDGHDVVAVDYEFSSMLLTDAASAARSEPSLEEVGGSWTEPFNLPIDPEMVLQRTGFACIDESDYPFNSVDSEEIDAFYDQDAEVEDGLSNVDQAHFTRQPEESCLDALTLHVGRIDTGVTFERIAWDANIADQFRYGAVTGDDPDLAVYKPDTAASRTTYRYVHESSCETVEASVSGTGWRRLLQFATADENVGNRPLVIGEVDQLDAHNLFEFSPCHQHYHFNYYGQLEWQGGGQAVNSKKGFCLQSTARTSNRETSPLYNAFNTCTYQGIEAGWADQYIAGLPSQWIDTTPFPEGTGSRSFTSNPNGFLCEGTFIDAEGKPLDAGDEVLWAPTGLIAANGNPVEMPRCTLKDAWDSNNTETVSETISAHGEGLITAPCTRGQIGPLRNCGFGSAPVVFDCAAGQETTATFAIAPDAAPQVVRVTEFSHVLNSAIPARYEDSWVPLSPGVSDQPYLLANAVVEASVPTTVTFTCPAPRTGANPEPGGTYAVYSAPVFPDDDAAPITKS